MRTSYHCHTTITHGHSTVSEYVSAAVAAGLDELGFAEHYVIRPPEMVDWRMEPGGLPAYCEAVLAARAEAEGRLVVRLGLEADFFPQAIAELSEILRSCPFDYVIGSVHFVDDFAVDKSADAWDALTERELNDMVRAYWARIAEMAKSGLFDIAAHLDLYKKFGHRPTIDVSTDIAAALDAIAEAGMAVELNTSGLHIGGEIYPSPAILRECHKRGIPSLVTTDAHHADHVVRSYEVGVQELRNAGYTEQATFAGRKITLVPLPL